MKRLLLTSLYLLTIASAETLVIKTAEQKELVYDISSKPESPRLLSQPTQKQQENPSLLSLFPSENQVSLGETRLPVGIWPIASAITPSQRYAIVANAGLQGRSDGHADTISVIDLKSTPPRVIDHITIGDAPSSVAITPTGNLAVIPLIQGSDEQSQDKWFSRAEGALAIVSLNDTGAHFLGTLKTGRTPIGATFNSAGTHLYIAHREEQNIAIFRVTGNRLTRGPVIQLPKRPLSLTLR